MKTALETFRTLLLTLLAAALAVAAAGPALAQGQPGVPTGDPYLVEDLGPDPRSVLSSGIRGVVEVNDRLVATLPAIGTFLWSSTGEAAGTGVLLERMEGLRMIASTEEFGLFVETVVTDGARHLLWVTDGTEAGTRVLAPSSGFVTSGNALGDQVVFQVAGGTEPGVWATDGTAAGTRRLAHDGLGSLLELDEAVELAGGRLVFRGDGRADLGRAPLWVSDGTEAGTFVIEETAGGQPIQAVFWYPQATDGEVVVFAGRTEADGVELFVTDGTRAGTRRAAEIAPGSADARISGDVVYSDALDDFFVLAGRRGTPLDLWRIDPETPQGEKLTDLAGQGIVLGLAHSFPELYAVGDRLVIVGSPRGEPDALYGHDGQPGPVVELPVPGTVDEAFEDGPDGRLLVVVGIGGGDAETWITDGTVAGTEFYVDEELTLFHVTQAGDRLGTLEATDGTERLVRLTSTGPVTLLDLGDPDTTVATILGDTGQEAFFLTNDLLPPGSGLGGATLYVTDGTAAGTRELPTPVIKEQTRIPTSIVERVRFGDQLAFTVRDGDNPNDSFFYYPTTPAQSLWLSDGTAAGTRELYRSPTVPGLGRVGIFDLRVQGDRLVFLRLAGTGEAPLWEVRTVRVDGSTRQLLTVPVEPNSEFRDETIGLVKSRQRIYLQTTDGFRLLPPGSDTFGPSIEIRWRRDRSGDDDEPLRFGDLDVFLAGSTTTPRPGMFTVVATDGTAAGTRVLVEEPGQALDLMRWEGGLVFLSRQFDLRVPRLWVTDGTVAGTRVVELFDPRPEIISDLVVAGGTLYVETREQQDGPPSLWAVPGLDATPERLVESRFLREQEPLGGRLVFSAYDPATGWEPWITDGTAAGTGLVADLEPGVASSRPEQLHTVGARLYFSAETRDFGREPWVTDGTAAGTRRLGDLWTGPRGSEPELFLPVDDLLFFEAADADLGRELFALPITSVDGDGGGGGGEPGGEIPPRPNTEPLASPQVPGFRFWVEITPQGQGRIVGSAEGACIPETLCVSGALAGRTEVFLRVIGPRPNGLLWPVITRFTPSRVEVWIEQASTGDLRYYDLPATDPDATTGDLTGLFDRDGFVP